LFDSCDGNLQVGPGSHSHFLIKGEGIRKGVDGKPRFRTYREINIPIESQEYYFKRLDHIVLPNIRRLQDRFRDAHLEIIHTRIMSMTQDGRERSRGHKRLNLHAPPGSKDAEFLPEVAPKGDEITENAFMKFEDEPANQNQDILERRSRSRREIGSCGGGETINNRVVS